MAVTNLMRAETVSGLQRKIIALTDLLRRFALPMLQLMSRLAVALVFLKGSLSKIGNRECTVA